MRSARLRPLSLLFGLLAMLAGAPSWAQQDIGETSVVKNRVTGTIGATVRRLDVADQVFQDEWIETARESATEIVFLDETTMTFGPEARVKLDTFVFDPDPSLGKVVVDVTQGLFRFATGTMHDSVYEIRTPTATLAVRGTEIEIYVDPVTKDTTVILREGAVLVSSCPERDRNQTALWDEPCTTGETQLLQTGDTAVFISASGAPPTAPGTPLESIDALIDELDELIVAALVEQLETAAGGETVESEPPPPPPPAPSVTSEPSETAENPSTTSASPAG